MNNPTDDTWKDQLLEEPYLTGLTLVQLPPEARAWIESFPKVWVSFAPHEDGLTNLLHRDNAKLRRGGGRG